MTEGQTGCQLSYSVALPGLDRICFHKYNLHIKGKPVQLFLYISASYISVIGAGARFCAVVPRDPVANPWLKTLQVSPIM